MKNLENGPISFSSNPTFTRIARSSLGVVAGLGIAMPCLADSGSRRFGSALVGEAGVVLETKEISWSSDEPTRMPAPPEQAPVAPLPSTSNSAPNFLPPMQSIGAVSIQIAPKPKGNSNLVPESQVASIMGPIATVTPQWVQSHPGQIYSPSRPASAVPYQPLYFEEVNLERYGRGCGAIQPAVSGMRFLATIPALPYAMSVHDSRKAYYWNWPYPAGAAAPPVRELPPVQWDSLLLEGTAITGAAFLIP